MSSPENSEHERVVEKTRSPTPTESQLISELSKSGSPIDSFGDISQKTALNLVGRSDYQKGDGSKDHLLQRMMNTVDGSSIAQTGTIQAFDPSNKDSPSDSLSDKVASILQSQPASAPTPAAVSEPKNEKEILPPNVPVSSDKTSATSPRNEPIIASIPSSSGSNTSRSIPGAFKRNPNQGYAPLTTSTYGAAVNSTPSGQTGASNGYANSSYAAPSSTKTIVPMQPPSNMKMPKSTSATSPPMATFNYTPAKATSSQIATTPYVAKITAAPSNPKSSVAPPAAPSKEHPKIVDSPILSISSATISSNTQQQSKTASQALPEQAHPTTTTDPAIPKGILRTKIQPPIVVDGVKEPITLEMATELNSRRPDHIDQTKSNPTLVEPVPSRPLSMPTNQTQTSSSSTMTAPVIEPTKPVSNIVDGTVNILDTGIRPSVPHMSPLNHVRAVQSTQKTVGIVETLQRQVDESNRFRSEQTAGQQQEQPAKDNLQYQQQHPTAQSEPVVYDYSASSSSGDGNSHQTLTNQPNQSQVSSYQMLQNAAGTFKDHVQVTKSYSNDLHRELEQNTMVQSSSNASEPQQPSELTSEVPIESPKDVLYKSPFQADLHQFQSKASQRYDGPQGIMPFPNFGDYPTEIVDHDQQTEDIDADEQYRNSMNANNYINYTEPPKPRFSWWEEQMKMIEDALSEDTGPKIDKCVREDENYQARLAEMQIATRDYNLMVKESSDLKPSTQNSKQYYPDEESAKYLEKLAIQQSIAFELYQECFQMQQSLLAHYTAEYEKRTGYLRLIGECFDTVSVRHAKMMRYDLIENPSLKMELLKIHANETWRHCIFLYQFAAENNQNPTEVLPPIVIQATNMCANIEKQFPNTLS